MKASEVSLNNFLSQTKTQFIIPVYQRNYDWSEEQCRQLFYDIIEVGSKPGNTHFIGSIVFIHEGVYTSNEVKQLVVIDGQQRLTTFSLLYLALFRFAAENGLEEKAAEINDTFLINKYAKEDSNKLKLKQSANNAKAFKYLLSNNNPNQYSEFSKVISNYSYFRQHISIGNFETILMGLNSLLFVEISLERDKDDPQRIFESLNSTGLELSQADLIRNYILMGLAPENQVKIFETYWDIIESNAKDINQEESKVSDFIRDYLTFKNKKIPNKNAVYDEFKLRYADRNSKFYTETIDEIKTFSFHYTKLINPAKELDSEIQRELDYINRLEINVSFPFLLPVFHDYYIKVIDKNTFIQVLKLVQSYTWRRFIWGLPTNALNKLFMNLYSDVDVSDYLVSVQKALIKKKGIQKFPTNSEIEIALAEKDVYNIQAKNRMYFFELLENYNNREHVDINSPNITIEHIFPQTPEAKWRESISEGDYNLMSEKYLNTIGNLTLSGNNGSLSNKTFKEKKTFNRNEKQQGYEFSRLWLNQYLKEIEEWNLASLQNRLKIIFDRFLKIWDYPEVEIDEDIDEDYTIYNAPDPKYKKLDYFIFRDEKIETGDMSKMYCHVIKKLYEENQAAFSHPEIKEIIALTTDPSEFRFPFQLNSSYYVETNIDNNSKFRKLKSLLTIFKLEEDLLINFSNNEIDETNTEERSRDSWEDWVGSESLQIMDYCFGLIQDIDQDYIQNYTLKYVGVKKNKSVNNFVVFVPKQAFIHVDISVSNPSMWVEKLLQSRFKVNSIGKKGRLKFRIDKDSITFQRDILKEIFQVAIEEWNVN